MSKYIKIDVKDNNSVREVNSSVVIHFKKFQLSYFKNLRLCKIIPDLYFNLTFLSSPSFFRLFPFP